MWKNKFFVLSIAASSFLAGILLISFSPSVETFAQRIIKSSTQFENNWQYCVITRVKVDNPPQDRLDKFTGNIYINYFYYTYDRTTVKESYVKTECVTHELNYPEFLQDNGLKNSPQAQLIASSRAADLALAKAMTRLGSSGWEMIGRSFANVNFETLDGNADYKHSLYFRRLINQRQVNSQQ
jgi:hypothetical protein